MPEGYLPILVMLVIATGFAGIALGVPALPGSSPAEPSQR